MLNIFLLVIFQQYDEFYKKEENPHEMFKEILTKFKKSWCMSAGIQANGHKMMISHLNQFINEVYEKIFENKKLDTISKTKKFILDLRLLVYLIK